MFDFAPNTCNIELPSTKLLWESEKKTQIEQNPYRTSLFYEKLVLRAFLLIWSVFLFPP